MALKHLLVLDHSGVKVTTFNLNERSGIYGSNCYSRDCASQM
jgi:hypothetical protein